VRRLIINADDFGLTSGVNRAIVEAHLQGIVTSATLMANGGALQEAIQLAQSAPRMSVGCHVVLVDGTPLSDRSKIQSLLDSKNGDRSFLTALSSFALKCLRGQLADNEMEAEATAQVRKLQSLGIAVSHLDTHKHTHMFSQVLRPLLRAAKNCGVHAIRNPLEPIRLGEIAGQPTLWKRWGQVRILNRLAHEFHNAVKEAGMVTPDGTLGIVATGVMNERILKAIIERIPDGTWELVCHPGYNDDDLARAGTRLRASRVQELELLKSPRVREELDKHKVDLISYREIA
jgi:hopanoid biosynthesis associated protein HpnK